MTQFRKKPVIIDAMRYTETNAEEVRVFCAGAASLVRGEMHITTPEGTLHAKKDDWIVRGTTGEFYPVTAAIFPTIYDPVED